MASCLAVGVHAAEVIVAVAANFAAPMQPLAQAFERETGHRLRVSLGSTGALYAQVRNGAPFEVFLSADDRTPARLEQENAVVPGSRFIYATGRLALWSAQPGLVDERGDVLRRTREMRITRLALANPKLAPYGAAAVEVMERLHLRAQLEPLWVQGDNIAQAYQFVASGNASLGFVALSQVMREGRPGSGSVWIVPSSLHAPLRQEAALLRRGEASVAARAFLSFMRSASARAIIAAHGYELEGGSP